MRPLNIPLFMTHTNIIDFIENLRKAHGLYVGFIERSDTSFTFDINIFKKEEQIKYDELIVNSRVVVMSINDFNLSNLDRSHLFLENNPNVLSIEIGEQTQLYLKQSRVYTLKILDDKASLKLWQKIGRNLKENSITGGYSVLKETKERKFQKLLRYTYEAKKKYENGLEILPSGGNKIHYELTKPALRSLPAS